MRLTVPFDTLEEAYHCADIHIRLVKRHDEYRAVLAKYYAQLKARGTRNGVIVVAGDIVHAKTDMSPEMVELASEFLTALADIAPTLVIAGNHDLNLSNKDRLDSLSPIIKNIGHPHLHYLKHSGVYQVADVDFAVMSILDDPEDWPTASDCRKTARKIALYHGPVNGATTDADFKITNKDVTISTFDGFDIAMLGDIHKYQILQKRSVNKPIIVYSSSLIQQNHGETLGNHGWCHWDIEKCTHDFIEVPNEFGYYTLEMVDGKVTIPPDMPKSVRLRLFTGDAELPAIKKAVSLIKKRHTVIELSINKNKFTIGTVAKSKVTSANNDVTDITVQNTLLTAWLKKNHVNIDEDMIKRVLDINEKTNTEIIHDDQSRNVHWKPLKFTFSNMFSYGEGNEIDFETMKGIHGIFAANASGKSSSVDALIYCLYDKTPRAYKGDHIMNNRKDKFECELKFEINGEVFCVRRVGTRKKSGDVKVEVSFWKELEDGTHLSLNGEERRQTNQSIRNYVGSYEDFVLTSLSSQSPTSLFIDKSHSERKDLLIQFMGLNIFDKLHDSANEQFKEMTGVLKKWNGINLQERQSSVEGLLNYTSLEYKAGDVRLGQLKSEIKTLYGQIEDLRSCIQSLPDVDLDQARVRNRFDGATTRLAAQTNKMNELKEQLDEFAKSLAIKVKELSAFSTIRSGLLDSVGVVKKETEHLANISRKFDLHTVRLAQLDKTIRSLEEFKFNPDCSVCVDNNKNQIQELESNVGTRILLSEELKLLTDAITDSKNIIERETPRVAEHERLLVLEKGLELLKHSGLQLQTELDKVTAQRELTVKEIGELQAQLDLYVKLHDVIKSNAEYEHQIAEKKQELLDVQKTVSTEEIRVRKLHSEMTLQTAELERVTRETKEVEEMEDRYDAFELYLSATCRDGVPYDLMSNAVPAIEAEINNVLTQMVDFTVTLEVDTKNIVGKLNYDHERIWPLENSSGMEKFLTSLAIRVALLSASNLPKSNFMIIDEGLGVLDADNLSSMGNLLNILKSQFDFLVIISHLEAARDMVEKVIEIKREDGYSYITV